VLVLAFAIAPAETPDDATAARARSLDTRERGAAAPRRGSCCSPRISSGEWRCSAARFASIPTRNRSPHWWRQLAHDAGIVGILAAGRIAGTRWRDPCSAARSPPHSASAGAGASPTLRIGCAGSRLPAPVAVAIVLPLLQVHAFDSERRRWAAVLCAAAALGMLVALPYALANPAAPWMWNRAVRTIFVTATVATMLAEAVLLDAALQTWRTAGGQTKQLVAELARLQRGSPPMAMASCWCPIASAASPSDALPRRIHVAPGAAEAAVVATGRADRSGSRCVAREHPPRGDRCAEALPGAGGVAGGGRRPRYAGGFPTDYFCWDTAARGSLRLALPAPFTGEHWLPAWKKALAESSCETLARAVPDR